MSAASAAKGAAALEAEGLRVSFPAPPGAAAARTPVVDGLDLQIAAGEALALVGESGSGKSVSALALMRLVPRPGRTDAGSVRLAGRELLPLPVPAMRAVRGGELSMIFQEPMTSLSPVATVGSQVVEAIRLHARVSGRAARARTAELFAKVGIPDPVQRLHAYPHQLSGGVKQRVCIAMAIATEPRVLIADEPTTALDVTIQAQILELLRELQRDLGTAILLITHDLGIVNELADRVAVMYAGRIVEEAPRKALLGAPRHPYTRGLLRSMPSLARPGERLEEIPGVVPPPSEWPTGCRFATRCPERFDPCAAQIPEATQVGPGHRAFCFAVERQEADVVEGLKLGDITRLLAPKPKIFEQLAVDLMLAKHDLPAEAGEVTGNKDKGVDGVIHLDKERTICVQAKCWEPGGRRVGGPDINGFSGAIRQYDGDEGIFFATSGFTKDAKSAARKLGISLVDGDEIIQLISEYSWCWRRVSDAASSPAPTVEAEMSLPTSDVEEKLERIRRLNRFEFNSMAGQILISIFDLGGDVGLLDHTGDVESGSVYDAPPEIFPVYMQAVRYAGGNSVDASSIREFYEAMKLNNAKTGVFLTTSVFTSSAKEEAARFGIHLMDGDELSWLVSEGEIDLSEYEVHP